jgi:predicted nucleic acid-binding protein
MSKAEGTGRIVCDASPLIFLAKADHLHLLDTIPGGDCVVVESVARELVASTAGPVEKSRLEAWLSRVEVVSTPGRIVESQALSASDHASLAWAVEQQAAWVVADDRLLRRFARDHGMAVIGFCGILLQAAARGLLPAARARHLLDEAIRLHGLRLSLPVYQAALGKLDDFMP